MLDVSIQKMLNIFNYFDGIIITDEKGVIKYYANFRMDVYNLRIESILGKSILKIHPELKEEESTIMQVLKTGKPVYDHVEHLTTPHGDCITNICSTLPITQGGKIVGAIDFSRCIDDNVNTNIARNYINLPKSNHSDTELFTLEDIITTSHKVNNIKKLIPMIANTDSSVMITGETGTGKEMIAQSIHTSGVRASQNFVSQNCAAIPTNLLESILFGTEKGSFTGAENKAGLFEVANGGTLFLDEINSMDMSMQSKILKAIEEKKVRRVGGTEEFSFDVKVISAVNKEPIECIQKNTLRGDLFYRLSTVLIEIPPLRDRIADISLLVNYFINHNNVKMNKNVIGVSDNVMELLLNYNWPGNVRELKNVMEGAFNVIGSNVIQMENLPAYMTKSYGTENDLILAQGENMNLNEKVEEFEKRLIVKALDVSKNSSTAADLLGISKQALHYKMLKHGIKK